MKEMVNDIFASRQSKKINSLELIIRNLLVIC